ncbi:MAG: 2-amino-4-hydroxy-6-hydroxymethyldihydropteridine diphosphokinase [Candidatus Omnitrophica bacterium]|nr:2-amino-4-hydroxy-6-hydroxymethyldihydropteridine diphosphokinase [Candidatus Omnitrophota bacterium]
MATVYLGIGSNIGDKEANLARAVKYLEEIRGIDVLETSTLYETEPVGGPPQDKYLNGVVKVDTAIPPDRLLREVKQIELRMGRKQPGRNCPRIIDLDILLYGDMVLDMEELKIPHPRMAERSFVLKGLAEIAPDAVHPVLGRTASELYGEAIKKGE